MGRNKYTPPTDEAAAVEELSKGWPKRLIGHPLHAQHPLLKALRPAYTCDSCHTAGAGDWSFYCAACDFDLHPNCALEAQLVDAAKPWPRTLEHRLHRPHPLVKTRLDTFWCDSCGERGTWWCFYCEQCDFSLHLHCAFAPETAAGADRLQQPPERLALELVSAAVESYWCSKCAEEGKGACFRCEDYGVDVHPRCVAKGIQWPGSVAHKLHEHELVKSRAERYFCDDCWSEGRGCYFGCRDGCDFGLHPRCATAVEVEGPGSWVEQMLHGRRKEEVLQSFQQEQEQQVQQAAGGGGGGAREEEVGGDGSVAINDQTLEMLLKRAEEEAAQRVQVESSMSQLEQLRLYVEAISTFRGDGAAAVLAAMADGVPQRRRDPPHGSGFNRSK